MKFTDDQLVGTWLIEKMSDDDGGGYRIYCPRLGLGTLYGVGDTIKEAIESLWTVVENEAMVLITADEYAYGDSAEDA